MKTGLLATCTVKSLLCHNFVSCFCFVVLLGMVEMFIVNCVDSISLSIVLSLFMNSDNLEKGAC